ncbi:DUF4349 domain-containing protein [Botryobacter ruber]|uniref:DUF4349 domain-containing protein n=1 Tax=Botryobacter ruber TaxID=2171629 RepID=UPI000E09E0E7|nr:DUF4349 domain-containing protein [Botryobacter ruber]
MRNSIFFFLLLLGLFSGCAASEQVPARQAEAPVRVQSEAVLQQETTIGYKGIAETEYAEAGSLERKVLYSAVLHMLVKSPDSTNLLIGRIAETYNGYLHEAGTYKTVIRVESKFLNSAIADIAALGELESKTLHGQDVTDQFLDFQLRLENAEKARETYLLLLEEAETVAEAVLVEKELERLNGVIETLKGKMNRISHLSQFSTITIHLKEKKKPGILGYAGLGIYHSVKWLFVRN